MEIKENIYDYLGRYPEALRLFQELETAGHIYLIGGVLREFIDHRQIKELRDIDIIIDVHDNDRWLLTLQKYHLQRNRFGGNKINCEGLLIDVWPIGQTWAFREGKINCTPNEYAQHLPETVFLNIDGIIYDWDQDMWFGSRYHEAMNRQTIDVVLKDNPQIPLNIVRAFVLQEKYHMAFSTALIHIIWEECKKCTGINNFAELLDGEQMKRYHKRIFTKECLVKKINELCG